MGTRRYERFDDGEDLKAPERTPEGFLRVDGFVSRPGIYEYVNTPEDEADGLGKAGTIRRELRPDTEVFSERSMSSYAAKSITVGHPRKNGKRVRVDAKNVREHEVGAVDGGARRVGDRLAASLLVKDAAAIQAVESGKKRLSPGHFIDLLVTSGVDPKYGRYDAIQTEIDVNHLALVDRARGGDSLRLRMDDGEDIRGAELRTDEAGGKLTTAVDGHAHLVRLLDWGGQPSTSGETSHALAEGASEGHSHPWVRNSDGTITIAESGGHTHALVEERTSPLFAPMRSDGDDNMADPVKPQQPREDELEQLRGEIKQLEKERDGLKVKLQERFDAAEVEAVKKANERADAAEAKLDEMRTGFRAQVRAFAALENTAHTVMGDTYRTDGKDDVEIMRDVVKRLDPTLDVTSTPVPELRGHFKQLVARTQRAREDHADAAKILGTGTRNDSEARARKQKIDDDWNNQWKKPLGQNQER